MQMADQHGADLVGVDPLSRRAVIVVAPQSSSTVGAAGASSASAMQVW
jgi:hypothetical protein